MPQRAWLPIVALLAAAGCSKKEEPEPEPIAPVQVAPVTREPIRRFVAADGVLFPENQASVIPKIASPVERFLVNRGDHVRQGQLLAVLENRDLTAAMAESRGQVAQAESNYRSTSAATVPEALVKARTDTASAKEQLDAANKLFESRQKLFEEGALARRQVDEAQVAKAQAEAQYESAREHLRALGAVSQQEQIKTAQAQVEQAQAHLHASEAQAGYAEIRSPIDGVIADRPLYAGEISSPGTPLFTVIEIARVVARINVPQSEAAFVKLGNPVTITAADSGQSLAGKVIVVSPATDPASTTVQVWVEAANPNEAWKPGLSVRAGIVTATVPDAIVVPAAALLPAPDGRTLVMTVGSDSLAHAKIVEPGIREAAKIQILSGVSPGEQVIVSGGMGLADQAKVRIVPGVP